MSPKKILFPCPRCSASPFVSGNMPDTQRAVMEREFHDIEGRIMHECIHKTGHPKEALMEQLLKKQDEAMQND